ncbi:DUF4241 domain-containing protein [Terricaulis sp.]|uniref:DUF4241 domain-containing protein n=1 Tax=Terricaulis sp. TaxID=2768686 RepID=UPI003783F06D
MDLEFSAEFGAIAFFDTDTRERALSAAQGVKNAFDDWLAQYVMDGEKTRDFANVPLADGSNFVVCRSGWSNGTYCAFLGTDTSGAAAQLVIDFGIQ